MPLVHRVHATVERGGQRDVLVGDGDRLLDDVAGRNPPVQPIVGGKHAVVTVDDLVHVDVAYDDQGPGAGLAKGELQDELVAVAVAGDHGLDGVHLSGNQLLAVERAIALLDVTVVEQDLEGDVAVVAVEHHVGGDAVVGSRLGDHPRPDVDPGLPDAEVGRDGLVVDVDRMVSARQDRVVALVVPLVDERLALEVDGLGERVLVGDLVRVLLDLDLGEVDREGREHAELQVEVARALLGGEDARDLVVARLDLELLEVTELDGAGDVGVEAVRHEVVAPRDSGIVRLELHVPGLAVGLRGDEVELATHGPAATRDGVALELGLEQVGVDPGRRGRGLRRVRLGREVLEGIEVFLLQTLPLCRELPHLLRGLAAAKEQKRRQESSCSREAHSFHDKILLA